MQSFAISVGEDGRSRFSPLQLEQQSSEARLPVLSGGLQLMRVVGPRRQVCLPAYKHLAVILSGHAEIEAGNGSCKKNLGPADLFLVDDIGCSGHVMKTDGDFRVLQLGVPTDWNG